MKKFILLIPFFLAGIFSIANVFGDEGTQYKSTVSACDVDSKDGSFDSGDGYRYQNKGFYSDSGILCFGKHQVSSSGKYNLCREQGYEEEGREIDRLDLGNGFYSDKGFLCDKFGALEVREIASKKFLRSERKAICGGICETDDRFNLTQTIQADRFKFVGESNSNIYFSIGEDIYIRDSHYNYNGIEATLNGDQNYGTKLEDFKILNYPYFSDKNHIFYGHSTSSPNKMVIIEGADPSSFKALGFNWGYDKNSLYNGSKKMDVDFDRETITVVSYDTLIDKNHGYTKSGTISHRALMKIDGRNIKQLDLPFHMKTDYIEISAKTALILVIIGMFVGVFKKNRHFFTNILYYFFTLFVVYFGASWYYNYALTDKKRIAEGSIDRIRDFFGEYVVYPSFPLNNLVAQRTFSEEYLLGWELNIYFPIILLILSGFGFFIFFINRNRKLNYMFLFLLSLSTVLLTHMLISFM